MMVDLSKMMKTGGLTMKNHGRSIKNGGYNGGFPMKPCRSNMKNGVVFGGLSRSIT